MTNDSGKPVALITGSSQGIGEDIAVTLANKGYRLALCARSTKKLDIIAERLLEHLQPEEFILCTCDVQDSDAVEKSVNQVMQKLGRIDVLINNAGKVPRVGLLQELTVDDINTTLDTNLKGPMFFMRLVIPVMVEQGSGTIINVNSIAGKTAYPYWGIYDASKFGLRAITEAVAEEQRTNNIKVVGIYPGAVDTGIWDGLHLDHEPLRSGMLSVQDVTRSILYILEQPASVFIKELSLSPLQPTL